MLAKRIIPCLDVLDGRVVKGVRFQGHQDMGDAVDLALRYRDEGADELVFYDIAASADGRSLDYNWVSQIARVLDIPFCVAGGLRSRDAAIKALDFGADKISINSPALERPDLINEIAEVAGSQCVVIGIDSFQNEHGFFVHQYTGRVDKSRASGRATIDWAREVVARGAGEIVLNCMNQDGVRQGYDLLQLKPLADELTIPIVASGGAGEIAHFCDLFQHTRVSAALAASVFHKKLISIKDLKAALKAQNIPVRITT